MKTEMQLKNFTFSELRQNRITVHWPSIHLALNLHKMQVHTRYIMQARRCKAQIYKLTDPTIKIRRGPESSCNSAIKDLKGHVISSEIRRRNVKKGAG